MPGKLYFYVNFSTIKLNKAGSKVKSFGRPLLRDIEWMFFYLWEETRGFSGFLEDEDISCHRDLDNPDITNEDLLDLCLDDAGQIDPIKKYNLFRKELDADGNLIRKKYVRAREYLRTVHPRNLGRPLYFNEAKNFLMLGCHEATQKIRMYDGATKEASDIKVGDLLMGKDSEPRTVKKLIRNTGQLYKVHQNKGRDYVVSGSHLIALKDRNGKSVTRTAEDLAKLKLNKDNIIPSYKGYFSEAIEVENPVKSKLDPYTLGLWLGDGLSTSAIITNSDDEIAEYLLKKFPNLSVYNNTSKNSKRPNFKYNLKKEVTSVLRELNLLNNKHIPDWIFQMSIKDRLEFLAGLIDSDGCLDRTAYDFYQKDLNFCKSVEILCKSLGLSSTISKSKSIFKVHITGEITKIPSKLPRKKAKVNSKKYETYIKVTEERVDNYYGWELDKDNLYLLEDYTVTHNSRGFGKDLHEDSLLHGENGKFPIKDVKIGDRIYGADGNLTTVVNRFDYKDQVQYKVTLRDGREVISGGGHL